MLSAIKAHIQSIDQSGTFATLRFTASLNFVAGLTAIKRRLLTLTRNAEVGAVLLYDPVEECLDLWGVVQGDEDRCNIVFPDSNRVDNKIVIGDVHTHPPTQHYKNTVYLAPSFEDLLTAAERFEDATHSVFKYYMMSLVLTANEVYVILATAPLRRNDLQSYLRGKNSHNDQIKKAKVYLLQQVFEESLFDLTDSIHQQQLRSITQPTPRSTVKFWKANVEGSTAYGVGKVLEDSAPGYAQLLYETSIAQCYDMLQGTSIVLLRGAWATSDKVWPLHTNLTVDSAFATYKRTLDQHANTSKAKVYKSMSNSSKGKWSSTSSGLRCCQCLVVHQTTWSSVWGRWHKCNQCFSVYCSNCGDQLSWASTFSRGRKCKYAQQCGGTTELIS